MWRESWSRDCRLLRLPAYVRLSRLITGEPTSLIHAKTKLEPIKPAPPVTRIESSLFIVFSGCFLRPDCPTEDIETLALFGVLPQPLHAFLEKRRKDANKHPCNRCNHSNQAPLRKGLVVWNNRRIYNLNKRPFFCLV